MTLQEAFETEVMRRRDNSAYMLSRCDGTTPLNNSHPAREFRRTDCTICNGENLVVRYQSWENWFRDAIKEHSPIIPSVERLETAIKAANNKHTMHRLNHPEHTGPCSAATPDPYRLALLIHRELGGKE